MQGSVRSGDLEGNLQVALQIALADEGHDALFFPCGLYGVINEIRDRHGTRYVLGQERAQFSLIAALDVLCISVNIFGSVSDFHFVFVPFFDCFDGFRRGSDNSLHVSFALFDLFADLRLPLFHCAHLFLDRIHRLIGLGGLDLGLELCGTCLDLLDVKSKDLFSRHF